jgi:uncharacterized membrane protein
MSFSSKCPELLSAFHESALLPHTGKPQNGIAYRQAQNGETSIFDWPLLPVHISVGILAILSGATALSFRKGSRRHALAGEVFVLAMLTLGASAVYLALMKHQMGNVLGGTFAFYLVTTALLTARRRTGKRAFSIGSRFWFLWRSVSPSGSQV